MRTILAAFLVAVVVAAIPTLLDIRPPPSIHDEFAYLLQADTFARGRLSNPPHLHWQFFETLHVLNQPAYAAKFPPGQGMMLAVGQVLGDPIYGAVISIALACAATTWMLLACVPARWALLGGFLAASHPLVFTWGQNFWGGGVAMIGGALIVGALARAGRVARWVDGITCGVGLAIVLNSRPFEGTLLILIAAIATRALKRPNQLVARRFLLPIGALAVLTAGWMAYYNFRVTGSAVRLPDMEYTRQYMAAPRFWWMPATPEKSYRHEAIARFHRESEYQEYLRQTTAAGFLTAQAGKIAGLTREWLLRPPYTSILLLPACALAAWHWRRGRWLAAIVIGVPIAEIALTPWFRPHYMGVVMPAFFALATMGLLAINRRNRLFAKLAAGIVVAGQVAAIGFIVRQMIVAPNVAGLPREMAIQRLNDEPGKHLVFVRYEGRKQTIFEWVYNSADIDSQRIIFARDMGEPQNQQLRHYYRDRRAWLAIVRGVEFELIPPQPKK